MTDKQQTAVQWLMEVMNGHLTEEDMRYVINKALAMEQKQIEDAWTDGWLNRVNVNRSQEFFTDTYQTEP